VGRERVHGRVRLALYFQTVRHYSALATGLAFAPATGIVLLANMTSGRLAARFGVRPVIAGSAVLTAASLAGLLVTGPSTLYGAMAGQLTLLGLSLGLIVPAMTSALLGSVDKTRSGIASGTLNTARQTGSVIGVAVFGSFAAGGVVGGLHRALAVSIGLAQGAVVLSAALNPATG